MVRKLPWENDNTTKKAIKGVSTHASSPAPPKKGTKRHSSPSSDLDLVDADLNPITPSTPKRHKALQRHDKSPSTSPPPAPPSVHYMREGFAADDQWMMVEDEFLATAKLYTQHLHHAAYAEAKRRAAARGQDMLQVLQRARDGRTEQSFQTRLKLEARAMKARASSEDDEDEVEENEWLDPQLAVLMNSRKEAVALGKESRRLGKVRSETRAAKGYMRSPEKARRTKDVLGTNAGDAETAENDNGEPLYDTDESDDLDGLPRKPVTVVKPLAKSNKAVLEQAPARSTSSTTRTVTKPAPKAAGIFKPFAAAEPSKSKQKDSKYFSDNTIGRSSSAMPSGDSPRIESLSKAKAADTPATSFGMFGRSPPPKETVAEYMARRKAEKEKRKAQDKKRSSVAGGDTNGSTSRAKEIDDVPTFMM